MKKGFTRKELHYFVESGINLVNKNKISAFNYFKEKYDEFNLTFVINYFHDSKEHMKSLCEVIETELKEKIENQIQTSVKTSTIPRYTFYIFNPKYLEKGKEIFNEYADALFYDGKGNEIKIQDIPKRKGPFKVRNVEYTINFKVNTIKDVIALTDIFDNYAYRFLTNEKGNYILRHGMLVPNPNKTIPKKWIEPVIIVRSNEDEKLKTNLKKYSASFKIALTKGDEEFSTLVGNEYRYYKLINQLKEDCSKFPKYLRKKQPYKINSNNLIVVPRLVNKVFKNLLIGKSNFPENSS